MARPRKLTGAVRSKIVFVRLTPAEFLKLKQLAAAAGVPYGRYARACLVAHRRPRPIPHRTTVWRQFVRELTAIATNFRQLADATGDDTFAAWARYVGGEMLERTLDREDLTALVAERLDAINNAGHLVNAVARRANAGQALDPHHTADALTLLEDALKPLHQVVAATPPPPPKKPSKRRSRKSQPAATPSR